MKTTSVSFLIASAVILAAGQLRAAIKVGQKEVKEWQVAFRTPEGRFLGTQTGNLLAIAGNKIGSTQTFTLIDLNGEDVADGDEVKIRYTPNSGGVPDPSKASYWAEVKEGVKRSKQGDVFKIKKVNNKYAFQAPSGKFITATVTEGIVGVTDKLEGALLMEMLDLSEGRKSPKPFGQAATAELPKAAETNAPAAPVKPAAEAPAPSEKSAPTDKPATE